MLQPKKSSHQQPVVARRRGRSRRNIPRPPPSSEEDSDDEVKEEKIDEDGDDEDPEELEKIDPDEIDELNVFKGNRRKVGSIEVIWKVKFLLQVPECWNHENLHPCYGKNNFRMILVSNICMWFKWM